jgi:hypothetical protein
MTSFVAHRRLLHPADARLLRVSIIYVLPGLAVFYVVLSGLWLLPDHFFGMYGNHDGHWASWSARSILEWGGFLDFSPVSPLSGTGSPFLPNLPWLNPGALALAIPAPLPLQHLASMLVYLAELSTSLYLLYRHLEFSREQSYLATMLYICIFFIPLSGYTLALPWYTLAPFNAHLIAAMNVATIALIRVGYERVGFKLLFGFVFLAALFVGFASAPVTFVTYVPIYATLWLAFLIPFQAQRGAVLWRWATIAFSLLLLALMGVPFYLAAMAMTSARGDYSPPIFHPGWKLLSPAYWLELVSIVPLCANQMQLMCASSIIGWFEIVVLAGAAFLAFGATGTKRRYGFVIIALLALLHFYALLSIRQVLGRLHVVSTPYLMWAFFPLMPPAAVAAGGVVGRWLAGREAASSRWAPAATSCIVAAVALLVWVKFILPHQPRVPGRGPLGLGPIAHIPASKGPILDFLEQRIGLKPGSEFRGYAVTYLGSPDGLVRKLTNTPHERMTYDAYVAARTMLSDHFGNSFQRTDLWNNHIPTLEEYSQSVTRHMYYFNRDLLAEPQDQMDPLPASILLYRFDPRLLRVLGVRFVIADGSLSDPSVERVMTETGKDDATVNLYELAGTNLGQLSPTRVMWAADYPTAATALREPGEIGKRVVRLGRPEPLPELVSASRSRLIVLRDGYQLTTSAPGNAMVVLPIQFSHCWQIESAKSAELPRIFRANIVQTGILFKDNTDIRLRFAFEPWRTSCRLQDARDLAQFGFR